MLRSRNRRKRVYGLCSGKWELDSEKKSLEEKRSAILLGKERRLEPMRKWIETAVSIRKIAKSDDLAAKKSLLLEILGLNLKMENKKVGLAAEQFQISPLKPHWQALRAASEKAAHAGGNFGNSSFLVRLYNQVRTDFEQNG